LRDGTAPDALRRAFQVKKVKKIKK
jgi:hypothetical protein